jgi:PAS domain S-box-containing protein
MRTHFARLLKSPKFADESQTRAAEILHVILLTLFITFAFWAFFTDHPVTKFVTMGMSAMFLGLWLVMRRGFVNLANWCLLVFLIVGVTLIVYFNGSIRVPAVSGFVACIVVAGLTLGNRATIGSAILICAILFVLYRLEITWKLPVVYYTTTGLLQYLTYAGVVWVTAVLLMLARSSILNALALARRNAAALAELNQEMRMEIAERQQAEYALRESEGRYRTLFEMESDAILLVDFETMSVMDANHAATQLYGYDRNELLTMSTAQLVPGSGQHRQAAVLQDTLLYIPRRNIRSKDGRDFPVEVTARFFELEGKKLMLVAARDITERVHAEESLREYHEHLEDLVQERTAQLTSANQELESFSYSVAHDLRAPLRAIDGFSRALLEDHAEQINPDMRSYLDQVIAASENMGQLIDALLSLSRLALSEINLEAVDMSAMARAIVDDLRQRNPQRNVEFTIADGLVVTADRRLMQLVLANLLGNAWKFTAKRSPARIELGKEDGGAPTYFVRDNGVGFDMTYADELFGVFRRLHSDEEFPGTGIGLATVKRIISRHNGQVWATGEEGRGATFYFTIP